MNYFQDEEGAWDQAEYYAKKEENLSRKKSSFSVKEKIRKVFEIENVSQYHILISKIICKNTIFLSRKK